MDGPQLKLLLDTLALIRAEQEKTNKLLQQLLDMGRRRQ